jgi:16S rRNA (cytidine1402-2'-O)-methyltransferase
MATLYIVGTPIGNSQDISFRAVAILNRIRFICSEDSRVTQRLFAAVQKYDIPLQRTEKVFIRGDERSLYQAAGRVLALLSEGEDVALVSDRGMPAIADPGAQIVRSAAQAGHQIEAIPGGSALTTALSLSGFRYEQALFVGFVPKKTAQKQRFFHKTIDNIQTTTAVVFFEAPGRIHDTLSVLAKLYPQGEIFIGRELTKKNQQLVWSVLSTLEIASLRPQGEFTAVLLVKT